MRKKGKKERNKPRNRLLIIREQTDGCHRGGWWGMDERGNED